MNENTCKTDCRTSNNIPVACPEQIRYANLLNAGAWSGIAILCVTYLLYVFGVIEPHVPLNEVAANWHLGVDEYLANTNSPHGWGWAALLGTGDFLNFVGMALLAVMTIICYATLIGPYLAKKDFIFTCIVVAEIVVLSLAASGLLGSGGH